MLTVTLIVCLSVVIGQETHGVALWYVFRVFGDEFCIDQLSTLPFPVLSSTHL